MNETDHKNKCVECRKEIQEGQSAIQLRKGIWGVLNFVPLEEPKNFCNERCLLDYFIGSKDKHTLPKRIP